MPLYLRQHPEALFKVVLTVCCPRPSAQPSKSAIKTGPEADKMCDKGKKVSGDFHFFSSEFRSQMMLGLSCTFIY